MYSCKYLEYDPLYWNNTHPSTNCYSYATNIESIIDEKDEDGEYLMLQPGDLSNNYGETDHDCDSILRKVYLDYPDMEPISEYEPIDCNRHKIALAVDTLGETDYHFWRQDSNGLWSHKPGAEDISNVDGSGNLIFSPYLSDRNYDKENSDEYNYEKFCGYFSILTKSRSSKKLEGVI